MANTKAPALVKRLTQALEQLGYTTEEAQDMISNEGTASIATFIQSELEFAAQQQNTQETAKVTLTPTEEPNMALVIEHNTDGTQKTIRTIETGFGIAPAKPLPQEPKSTEVSASVQISNKPTPNEQAPAQELMYDYHKLPANLQRLVDDISLHHMPTTAQLPVIHIVGWNEEAGEFIYKLSAGLETANAYQWLYTTDAKAWQRIPCILVAPTDAALLAKYNSTTSKVLPAQAEYKLMSPKVIACVASLQMQDYAVVVPAPASEPKATAKVAAKARKADAKAEAEAQKEPVTEQLLSELATATNHMKKVSLVNKVLTALGEPKVASKVTKVELQPTIERLLKTMGVAPAVAPVKEEKAPAKAKAAVKALTKGDIEKLWIAAHIRETGVDTKVAKKAFAALDINWRSSVERAEFVVNQGLA